MRLINNITTAPTYIFRKEWGILHNCIYRYNANNAIKLYETRYNSFSIAWTIKKKLISLNFISTNQLLKMKIFCWVKLFIIHHCFSPLSNVKKNIFAGNSTFNYFTRGSKKKTEEGQFIFNKSEAVAKKQKSNIKFFFKQKERKKDNKEVYDKGSEYVIG